MEPKRITVILHLSTGSSIQRRVNSKWDQSVNDEVNGYQLNLGGYFGNPGDSMNTHNNCIFSTRDEDNDDNPLFKHAERYSGRSP